MSHPQNDKINDFKSEQAATIILSRQTLERLQNDFWTLTVKEAQQINQALEAMKINDELEPINVVPNPPGTFSHPNN